MTNINIHSRPEDVAGWIRNLKFVQSSDLLSVEDIAQDKWTKKKVSVESLLPATLNLNGQAPVVSVVLDGDGFPCFPSREAGTTYHTQQTWRDMGLLNPGTEGYQSITGGDLYHDVNLSRFGKPQEACLRSKEECYQI
jgi:hypothetical protein